MLTYAIEERGELPIYDFLYRKIKQDILSGKLSAGEKLPSKRSLARHLQVAVITVENAYAQLLMEGYLYAVERKGYFVSEVLLEGGRAAGKWMEQEETQPLLWRKTAGEITVSGTGAEGTTATGAGEESQIVPEAGPGIEESRQNNRDPEYLLDLSGNRILPESFPFSLWSRLMRQVLSQQDIRLLEPLQYQGVYELRRAIAGHLGDFRGMEVDPEQIVVGAGTEYLYTLIIQLLGRNHIYGVENPGYQKIAQIYQSNDVACRWLPLDQNGLSVEALRNSDAEVIHISPGHHFPTGIVMPVRRRQELLAWAGENEMRYIIEDDYDSEFRFQSRPAPTLQSIDLQEKVIYMNTFSKTMAPSIRISYMVLPPRLALRYREKLGMYACTVSSFEQYTLARFLEEGYFEQHINRMRNFYRKQRNQMIHAIRESRIAPRLKILEENAGLHFLLQVDTELTDEELIARIADHKIRVKSLKDYTYGAESYGEHLLIINYSGIREEDIRRGLTLLENIL